MKKRYAFPIIIISAMIILNIAAVFSRQFADFYVMNIFPHISDIFSFISGIFPFSVGEVLIILGIVLVLVGIPLFAILIIFGKNFRKKTCGIYSTVFLWILTFIMTTETLNCFIMYRCTPFSERYFPTSEEHTRSELTELYGILIKECNTLSQQVQRDENNMFVLTADVDIYAKEAMKKAAEKYPQLKGYYPDAKPIASSYFMSQSSLLGIYFPFTLEANYNDDMYKVNLPNTMCHEYAHLKGIIQEDEAGFIAFIASTNSDNPDFRYSGYLNALEYVHNEVYKNNIDEAFSLSDTIADEVKNDWFRLVADDYWEENEEKEIIATETIDAVSDAATDTTLKINGVEDGIESYTRIVNLLLDYYFSE